MNIQIIGTRKCSNTRKAERFFKERGIGFQFVDLNQRGLSRGELQNISRALDPDELLDRSSRAFRRRGMEYMVFDPLEELARDPLLIKTPVVRMDREVTVGYQPEIWQSWIERASTGPHGSE